MLYIAAVMNLLLGIFLIALVRSFFAEADQSISRADVLIGLVISITGIFFLYWGIRAAAAQVKIGKEKASAYAEEASRNAEAAHQKAAEAAHQKAEAARWEARVRAQADAEDRAALEAEVERTRRVELRDADSQAMPYEYQCIGHPNITLALRYGIANTSRSSWGEGRSIRENSAIWLRKMEKVQEDSAGAIYLAELADFGWRKVRVVIRPGTEFVLTFLPISDTWFDEHEDLERLLKDNPTFNLKELATFHVQAVLNAKR